MEQLKKFVDSITPISDEVYEIIQALAFKRKVEKGALLLQQGTVCKHIYLVTTGALRVFQYSEGKEITSRFTTPGTVITSFYSLISRTPTLENIQAIAYSEVVMIPYKALEIEFEKHHVLERLGRKILEDYFLKREERIMMLQSKSALERYQLLLAEHSELLQLASLGHIASYLGITQETLSRIRKKIR
ncbi:MAG: Crp/Fnr family transcriptional regulator [Cyclobacteriaceae bacterium]|nr:Crp/Fnr family transcriptional regulator [Cyclobacteriaceae bacterium]